MPLDKIVTSEEMRRAEKRAVALGITVTQLMENAGREVALEVRRLLGDVKGKKIMALIGPGNNGGDGLVAARYLADWGADLYLYIMGARFPNDRNLVLARKRKLQIKEMSADGNFAYLKESLPKMAALLDAVFGTGKKRPLSGLIQEALGIVADFKEVNQELLVVAVDNPSGMDTDTGKADPGSPGADTTVTLGFAKPGLFNSQDKAGKVVIADIGLPEGVADDVNLEVITEKRARSLLPKRPLNANKGTFGKVLLLAGSINYIGAAYLAASGAARVGAGLVTLAIPRRLVPVLASRLAEVTYLPLPDEGDRLEAERSLQIVQDNLLDYTVLAIGCGIGQSEAAATLVTRLIFDTAGKKPLVIDADGLNLLSHIPDWYLKFGEDAILTPHPGEVSRLSGISVADIQNDRLNKAKSLAQHWQKILVLKGAYSVIAAPDGRVRVINLASPVLASAGTGDVLTGIISGLVAQGTDLFEAACLGAYLHARAAEIVGRTIGDTGVLASDLLPILPQVIKMLKNDA